MLSPPPAVVFFPSDTLHGKHLHLHRNLHRFAAFPFAVAPVKPTTQRLTGRLAGRQATATAHQPQKLQPKLITRRNGGVFMCMTQLNSANGRVTNTRTRTGRANLAWLLVGLYIRAHKLCILLLYRFTGAPVFCF